MHEAVRRCILHCRMVTPFTLVLYGAALTVLVTAGLAWRRRKVPGGVALAHLFLAVATWCFFSGMETTSLTESQRYLWSSLSYIGLCNVAPLLLVAAIQYSDSAWPLTPWLLGVFWSVPVLTIGLAFTNSLHHLVWTGISAGPVAGTNTVIYHHGPWYPVEMLWFLGLSLLASFHLLRVAIRAARLYILQAATLLAAIVLPWIGLLLYVLPNGPFPGLDTTSPGFALSAILIMTAFSRLRFLDLVPKARATLVERMSDGFLVVDIQGRIIDINPTAARLLKLDSPVIGSNVCDVSKELGDLLAKHAGDETVPLSTPNSPDVALEVSGTRLTNRAGLQTGRILLVRDVTERRRAEKEREKLIADLQDAVASIRSLSGLLPICASCKKIRDDKGYWHQVEKYMQDHAEVEFSHGLCPDCMERLYPDPAAPLSSSDAQP